MATPAARPRVSPWFLVLTAVFVIVPIAELWLLVQTGQAIGTLPTILVVLGIALLGSWLAKREGSRAWKALNAAMRQGRMPQGELADAALILVGAVLLVFPGFFTDVFGLLFLLPFTRPLCRKLLQRLVEGRLPGLSVRAAMPNGQPRYESAGFDAGTFGGETIPGETVEQDGDPRQGGASRFGYDNAARTERVIDGEIER